MHVVVVANGDFQPGPRTLAALRDADLVICADGGADHVLGLGIVPHILIGDLDSTADETRRTLEDAGCQVVVFPREKDAGDTELAVQEAFLRGATRLTLLGALGGPRADHALANVLLLSLPMVQHIDARIVSEDSEIALVRRRIDLRGEAGQIVSLLPLTPLVEGVTTDGLLYPLSGATLRQGTTHGLSNVLVEPDARVEVGDGLLLVVKESLRAST